MPLVNIELWPGRDKETKGKIIQGVTKIVAETAKCPEDDVIVVIKDVPKENWGFGGQQAG